MNDVRCAPQTARESFKVVAERYATEPNVRNRTIPRKKGGEASAGLGWGAPRRRARLRRERGVGRGDASGEADVSLVSAERSPRPGGSEDLFGGGAEALREG